RRLALDYLDYETRAGYGIYTADERTRAVQTGSYEAPTLAEEDFDVEALSQSAPIEKSKLVETPVDPQLQTGGDFGGASPITGNTAVDAPLCFTCGVKMRPAGSCYVCESCGSTSGCS
ncbi:MAG: ribonucleoside-diphosphate reductase alpha chain, partial [Frankiales bacterium]|nr:ribonucleoside-diphosphate reductase alpha chain [Frankiales bacterium]